MQIIYLLPNYHYDSFMSNVSMFLYPTDSYEVISLIDSLKCKFSSGHDGITPSLFKDLKHEIALPLTMLINKSLNSGTVPDLLKLAKVVPIYKAKDKELLNNYRPISLLPTASKILEKVVHKRVYKFVLSQLNSIRANMDLDPITQQFMLLMNL